MAGDDRYTGPQPGVDANARLKERAARFIRRRAEQIYEEQVMAWAASDTGDYPSRVEAAQDALKELEILLHGIGQWGLFDPKELPGRSRRSDWFDMPDWERDLLE